MAVPDNLTNEQFKKSMLGENAKVKVGMNLNLFNPTVAEFCAATGYDWVMVDMQHSSFSYDQLASMFMAIKLGGAKSFVRVSGAGDRAMIQQCYDLGVDGILVPYVNTAQDVIDAVSVAKYPDPDDDKITGTRSLYVNVRGTGLKWGTGMAPITRTNEINKETIVAIQIETADAVKNLDEILAVPGLDIAFLGPGDLSLSMGKMQKLGMATFQDEEFQAAIAAVVKGCQANNVVPGFWGGKGMFTMLAGLGFKFICAGADIHTLISGMEATIGVVKQEISDAKVEWNPRGAKTA